MFDLVYVEDEVRHHPRVQRLLARYPRATVVGCERFGEVFNRRAQNFRLQKRRPALILARKHGELLLETPPGYALGGDRNYYFSHMLNCVYDCRYCFLQGMYRSAHLVLFVNYEEFQDAIRQHAAAGGGEPHFFSGYDCDSLALEPLTGFAAEFLPLFRELSGARFELRTKSVQIRGLLGGEPLPNCVVAFSFTPPATGARLEAGVPGVERRLEAAAALMERGWRVGLRFDPLIYTEDFESRYRELFRQVFERLDPQEVDSVSTGSFRLPGDVHRTMERLYPDEPLFVEGLGEQGGIVSYRDDLSGPLAEFCRGELLRRVPSARYFPCEPVAERPGAPQGGSTGLPGGA